MKKKFMIDATRIGNPTLIEEDNLKNYLWNKLKLYPDKNIEQIL